MKTLSKSLRNNLKELKTLLPSEDILSHAFETQNQIACAVVYADGIVDKQLLGDLVERPLSKLNLSEKSQNDGGRYAMKSKKTDEIAYAETSEDAKIVKITALFPDLSAVHAFEDAAREILDGNALLLVDGVATGFIVGAKALPTRAVSEPPTDVTVKGPREGFIEDVKTNMSLIRKRLKTPSLHFETLRVGRRSKTAVVLCWLQDVANTEIKEELKRKIEDIDIDNVPDSSYIAALVSPRKRSVFHNLGTTEKPDVFTAKICEGRVGVLVDGSPIALTAPFLLTEDLQSSEDYYTSPFSATTFRFIRCLALFVAVLLPAFYISAQLFKMQLLPLGLMLTIASSVRSLPLSPGLEMFVVLFLLETLKEASIRMPKYVGMSLSVVGALVLGETAVSAGFLSTPAIIVVAFSGICLYTVPNFVETGSLLRWLFLLMAGSLGPFGIILFVSFLLYYLLSTDVFGTPLIAPFSPLIKGDLRDSVVKYNTPSLKKRPRFLRPFNKIRLREKTQNDENDDTMYATNAKKEKK